MEKMVQNNMQLLVNRIPKAKRAQMILDMARVQHEKKRRIVINDSDDADDTHGHVHHQADATHDAIEDKENHHSVLPCHIAPSDTATASIHGSHKSPVGPFNTV